MYFTEAVVKSKSDTCMEISTYPEKFSDDITVDIRTDSEDHCIIVLSNQMGRILRMMGVNLNEGKNQIHVENVTGLEVGTYNLTVKNINSNILFSSILTKL
jgi:hypothetical protein